MTRKPQTRELDPQKITWQLDKLVAAIWGVAEDEIAEELKAEKGRFKSTHSSSTRRPQTLTP
ncbi:MAG: hypothetical protein ACYC6Z_06010 [Thermoleophilia bacterium]